MRKLSTVDMHYKKNISLDWKKIIQAGNANLHEEMNTRIINTWYV